MRSEFELKCLKLLLDRLLQDGFLKNEEQRSKLYDVYSKDSRQFHFIHDEIKKLRFDSSFLEQKLKENEKIIGKDIESLDLNKKVEYPLSLENISDFEKDGKMYIKIHYPAPFDSVRIIENMTDPYKSGKEIFESLKDTQTVVSLDGEKNATSIFEQVLLRDCREVKLKDIKEVSTPTEYAKLSFEEKEVVYGTLKSIISSLKVSDEVKNRLNNESIETVLKMINQKIYISPEYNIIVTCVPNEPQKDSVKELKYVLESGVKKYYLSSLTEDAYSYNSDEYIENEQGPTDSNSEYEKTKEEDLVEGSSLKQIPPWKRRKKDQAAFISIIWIAMFAGILASIISFYVIMHA